MKKKIHLFLFNGFSDWEISYLTPEIHKSDKFDLISFSKDGKPVVSVGGLHISPSVSLDQLAPKDIEMLILPGGTAWEKSENNEIVQLTEELFKKGISIAAICAATTFLANLGILNEIKHTSNDLNYLKAVAPDYKGESRYQNVWAYSDKNIITANGIASIEFAREVFKAISLYDEEGLEKWYQLFKNGVWS